jgi:hypothetical protein
MDRELPNVKWREARGEGDPKMEKMNRNLLSSKSLF